MRSYGFGVDIGGTSVKLGLFSGPGILVEKWEIPTRTRRQGEDILPDVAQALLSALARHSIDPDQVAGAGFGVPGPVDETGTVHKCANLGWGVFHLPGRVSQLLPWLPRVAVSNDANAAALGELRHGGGRGCRSAVMITLGTGVGGGVVLNGEILAGHNGGAGEIGHLTVQPEETLPCACGKRGCLEQYASARGVVRLARERLARCDTPSPLRSMEHFTAREVCDLARAGDPVALAVLDRFGEYLGRAMSFLACAVDPDVFILGGGMSRAGEVVTAPALRYFRRYAFHVSAHTGIVAAQLGNDAGIYGCAERILSARP